MKSIAALIVLLIVSPSARAGTPAPLVESEIRGLESELNAALSKVDAKAIDRLWADDFVFVNPSGRIANKAQRMERLKPPDPTAPALISTVDDVQIRVYGDSAVAIVRTTWRGSIDGKAIADPYIATHVWVHSAEQWRLASAHVSRVERQQ
jgi:ketosteroid isomerase-like protein